MTDFLKPDFSGPRPSLIPPGLRDWNGYRLPPKQASFDWRGLIEIAHANGFRLTHDLLKKWRVWRFLPGPTAGGATGAGRGKGETWPIGAGWRTAWISRWQADKLTYDVVRIALWLWTPDLEAHRARDVRHSLFNFVRQDEAFHGRFFDLLGEDFSDPSYDAYRDVILAGDSSLNDRQALLRTAGLNDDDPEFALNLPFMAYLNLDEMQRLFETATDQDVRTFIALFRASTAKYEAQVVDDFWSHPVGLARIIVREFYRCLLIDRGVLPANPPTE